MKAVAKWVVIVWSSICLLGIVSSLSRMGDSISSEMTDYEAAGAGAGFGCGLIIWMLFWAVIAVPGLVVWMVSGSGKPAAAPMPAPQTPTLCTSCGTYHEGTPAFCSKCGAAI